jgi:ATP-binding cassette subfamily F protein 3
MRAKDVLLEALQDYTGTVVFVSHDRYFMDKLATRVFEVEDGGVHVFPGNYEDYLWRKSGGPQSVAVSLDKAAATASSAPVKASDKRVNPMRLKQMKDRQVEIEQKIASLESQISEYESALSNFVSVEETKRTSDLLEAHKSKLAATLAEWEEVAQLTEAG